MPSLTTTAAKTQNNNSNKNTAKANNPEAGNMSGSGSVSVSSKEQTPENALGSNQGFQEKTGEIISGPLGQALMVVEKKVRNLEKRKVRRERERETGIEGGSKEKRFWWGRSA